MIDFTKPVQTRDGQPVEIITTKGNYTPEQLRMIAKNGRCSDKLGCDLAQAYASALEEARRDAERYQKLCTEFQAENSKLRSALELVHFKREPWQ